MASVKELCDKYSGIAGQKLWAAITEREIYPWFAWTAGWGTHVAKAGGAEDSRHKAAEKIESALSALADDRACAAMEADNV